MLKIKLSVIAHDPNEVCSQVDLVCKKAQISDYDINIQTQPYGQPSVKIDNLLGTDEQISSFNDAWDMIF